MKNHKLHLFLWTSLVSFLFLSSNIQAQDFKIYSVYNPLFLGDENTTPVRDFFINAGRLNGIQKGSVLKVYRKINSYDSILKKHYQDLTVPIGTIKVVHVDSKASVARIDKILPPEENAGMTSHSFLVGDIIRFE